MMREVLLRFIRNKVERVIYSLDSRCLMHLLLVQTCGNDEKRQPRNVVILGLDPGIQGVFNLPAKDTDLFLELMTETLSRDEPPLSGPALVLSYSRLIQR
jgi:hypothetical protein